MVPFVLHKIVVELIYLVRIHEKLGLSAPSSAIFGALWSGDHQTLQLLQASEHLIASLTLSLITDHKDLSYLNIDERRVGITKVPI